MAVNGLIIPAEKLTDLIAGCISGNRVCQKKLYTLAAPGMIIICMRYAKNLEEAEEILQDGFLKIFRFINQFKHQGSFEGWMKKIMVNAALQKLRSHVKMNPVFLIDDEEKYIYSNDIIENLSAKEMLKLIQTLSPAYRLVFNLYHFEGMKHREIAGLLQIEEGTSKSNLAQARRILQRAVTQQLKIAR
jgi:RNA polymerase sigma factor (sigma-70 family)